ncbi:MAG TPA: hypothetical protein VM535_02210 [Candidatus Saccharimonadales bacterium]|nr:hypothetical protein [Candidatus Saccharimonadales bacterium]
MDSAKKQLADRLKTANNILVTVNHDPSVDQLAACLGLTLLLNKLNKHTVAVFSGEVPSTIEFLKPEETLEKTTDSLRDFIIALDKDKADKLRYKVEDNVVRIFITPYKASISQEDLEFTQGDFNVDVVIALGVRQQEDLDQAITAHGRILHDATVASINTAADGGLGTINWHDPQASSLSELVTELAQMLGDNLLDNQVATALLTGIVAETGRFSNDKTSSQTMSASSALMAAGANQQLVASKLEEPAKPQAAAEKAPSDDQKGSSADAAKPDGTLDISHDKEETDKEPSAELPAPQSPDEPAPASGQPPAGPAAGSNLQPGAKLVTEPPTLGGSLTANSRPEGLDPVTDPLSLPPTEPNQLLNRPAGPTPGQPPTLTDLEKSVNSPHLGPTQLDTARDEVNDALRDSPTPTPTPIQALNAQPLGGELHPSPTPISTPMPTPTPLPDSTPTPTSVPTPGPPPVANSAMLPMSGPPPESSSTDPNLENSPDMLSPTPGINDSTAPPPVPPPIPFQFGNQQTPPNQPPPAQ